MLRILHVNTADIDGGAEMVARNLSAAYRRRGYAAWLAVGRKVSGDPAVLQIPDLPQPLFWSRLFLKLANQLTPLEERVPGIAALRRGLRLAASPGPALERWRGREDFHHPGSHRLLQLPPQKPQLIHGHNLHGRYFDLRLLATLSQQLPFAITLHDSWLLGGHCACSFDCQRWRIGCGDCPNLTTHPPARRDATAYNWQRKREIYAHSRLYIAAPSQWLIDRAQTSMLNGRRHQVIPNGVDLTLFRPGSQAEARATLNLPPNAKIILLITHSEFKDYDTMEAALRRLPTNSNDKLLFVCLGKIASDTAVGPGRMIYPGFERERKRMALYYRAADIYIHAAKDEAFGLTITEAMACGLPVVATAVGGIPEQIENGVNGFLTPPRDAAAMSHAIEQLLTDKKRRFRMGQAGSDLAQHRFGFEKQVDGYLLWYQTILEDWRRRER